jgi:hypothetical protein
VGWGNVRLWLRGEESYGQKELSRLNLRSTDSMLEVSREPNKSSIRAIQINHVKSPGILREEDCKLRLLATWS